MGVLPGELADCSYPDVAAELDLNSVRAVQNDELGLLDEAALGDERFNPRALAGELVLELVQERAKRHLLAVPGDRGHDMRRDRRHVLDTVEACAVACKAHRT